MYINMLYLGEKVSHHGSCLIFFLKDAINMRNVESNLAFNPEQLYEALTGPGWDSYTAIGGSFVPECSVVDNSVHTSVPLESSLSFVLWRTVPRSD